MKEQELNPGKPGDSDKHKGNQKGQDGNQGHHGNKHKHQGDDRPPMTSHALIHEPRID